MEKHAITSLPNPKVHAKSYPHDERWVINEEKLQGISKGEGGRMNKIVIELTAEKETETSEHSEKVTGSTPGYAKCVRKVMKKAKGLWGWCTVKVTVTIIDGDKKFTGTNYLGNCSYYSAEDFMKAGDYFDSMVKEAFDEALTLQKKG